MSVTTGKCRSLIFGPVLLSLPLTDSTYYPTGAAAPSKAPKYCKQSRTDPQLQLDESTERNLLLGGATTTSFTVKLASSRGNM